MTNYKIIISVCLLFFVFGCSEGNKDDRDFSASATAIRKSDGTVEVRETSKSESKKLDQNMDRYKEIEKKYPTPWSFEEISKLKLHKVKSVNNQGVITLEDGTTLIIEGVRCKPENLGYIAKLLSSDTERIAFIPSTNAEIRPTPAYIWSVSLVLMEDPELKDFVTTPSYSSLNESVITSGWCEAEQTENNKYYERYLALEEIAKSR
jgi:hypothetical protein